MIWGAKSSADVGLQCFMKFKVSTAIDKDILEHLALARCCLIFLQNFTPDHIATNIVCLIAECNIVFRVNMTQGKHTVYRVNKIYHIQQLETVASIHCKPQFAHSTQNIFGNSLHTKILV
ncbi:hypothetical protein ILYODFUR_021751 [Ilyodon furcidens]|uniref:Uncharacterized protein n=1 Tax=Ilyodon furcidens TaxID=33524 RepID=A0ABV0V513_9TELE